jgi:hypothetical protein
MQRYVASRPMFMDSEIMNLDARTVRSEFGQGGLPNLTKGLQTLYKEITGVCISFSWFVYSGMHEGCIVL